MAVYDDITRFKTGYTGALVGARNVSRGIAGALEKISSGTSTNSPAVIRDIFTNGFLAQKSIFVPEFFARAFDEPTYLTFRIEFINDPNETSYRNNAYNNDSIMGAAKTTVAYNRMYDFMPEPFLESYNVLTPSDADTSIGKTYSTETYLDMCLGDHARAQMLHTFKMALEDIQKNFPYYFKGISGLSSLMKVDPKNGARLKDAKITIECEEGIDLKITQLINLYRKIVWDDVYQRWTLPDMMRYFGMRIYISEIRLFQDRKRKNQKNPPVYDFGAPDTNTMNATFSPLDDDTTMGNGLKNAVAVSNTYLGTKSLISRALNYREGTSSTIGEVFDTIENALNDIEYCNNAINDVMPTICLECHMCEFDINDSMNYIDALSSSNKGSKAVSPKITIKIGQVTEAHSYPLNATLGRRLANNGDTLLDSYITLVKERKGPKSKSYIDSSIDSFASLSELRDNSMKFAGSLISDKTLTSRYSSPNLTRRIEEYVERLAHDTGDTKASTINVRRMTKGMIEKKGEMSYSRNSMTQQLAQAGLTAALLNEGVSLARRAGVDSNVVGTDSLALNQQKYLKDATEAVGDALNEVVERIYNGEEIQSMALSKQKKEKISSDLFDEFIRNLELSTATSQNTVLHEFLKNYKVLKNETPQ